MSEQVGDGLKAATYTIDEAAALLRIGRNQAYAAAGRGEIPTIRIGNTRSTRHSR